MEFKAVSVAHWAFLIAYISSFCSSSVAQECCPSLWTSFDDHCYRYFGNPTSWTDAEAQCAGSSVGKKGHLVSIHSENENSFVYRLWQSSITPNAEVIETVNKGNSLWIGFKNQSNGRGFKWSDGSESSYTFWKATEPSGEGEECVHGSVDSRWNGVQCVTKLPFICKLDLNPAVNQTFQTFGILQEQDQFPAQLHHHVCEHNTLHLECKKGEVLSIEYANYGRTNRDICSDNQWNTDADTCRTYNTKSILDANCEGCRVCDVPATNQMFGNPCGNVFKYLDVTYKCLEKPLTRAYVCEHQTLHLECKEGEGIVIHSANYGRLHRNVCSNNGWNKNTHSCRSETSIDIVRQMCNNQRSCDVPATNGQFGNPCGDIFKYLEVEYSCEAVDNPEQQYQYACEDNTLHLECEQGQGISILSANFGRLNRAICSDNFWYTDTDSCYSSTALSIVRSNCETYQECDVGATSTVFGYPCSGVFKYAEVTYKCQEREQLRRHVCEHETLHLECTKGEVISIEYANYGRTNRDVCSNNQWNKDADTCRTFNTKSILDAHCKDCRVCDVPATNQMFGNPCGNVFKYLDVTYKCLEKPSTRAYVCEHETLHLKCSEAEGIVIHSANYGRLHRNVCSNNEWNKNTHSCRSETSIDIVRQVCNNQQSCDVPATNGQFGNPCGDIFKYLEVEYSCEGNNVASVIP